MSKIDPPNNLRDEAKQSRIRTIIKDYQERRTAGESISDEAIITAHPDLMPELGEWVRRLRFSDSEQGRSTLSVESTQRPDLSCASCGTVMDFEDETCRECGASNSIANCVATDATTDAHSSSRAKSPAGNAPAKPPAAIGRYRIEKMLGRGGFGSVYLAHDDMLDRRVAVKVPHANLVSGRDEAEAYLSEARTSAALDHPHIVPVYDVGSTEEFSCYFVSKYVEGCDLSEKLRKSRFSFTEAAELVGKCADALHYAHKQGLVHRDVKPGNILIDKEGKPFLVDFGLALREENIGKGPKYAGTPAYMSPEQARGEGHRVDGRSDIFSLGVVFYEMLAGRRPFRGETRAELLEQITCYEPRPLRQYDETLPKELDRICYKAMAKRASDRYSSAHDLAEELRLFLRENTIAPLDASPRGGNSETRIPDSTSAGLGSSDNEPIKIIPKGLRSFDAHDADFFLEQ